MPASAGILTKVTRNYFLASAFLAAAASALAFLAAAAFSFLAALAAAFSSLVILAGLASALASALAAGAAGVAGVAAVAGAAGLAGVAAIGAPVWEAAKAPVAKRPAISTARSLFIWNFLETLLEKVPRTFRRPYRNGAGCRAVDTKMQILLEKSFAARI